MIAATRKRKAIAIVVFATIGLAACRHPGPPPPPPPPTCTPYLPDGGIFYNDPSVVRFNHVPTTPPARAGLYSISLNKQNQVVVIQGNNTSPDALINVPPGTIAFYLFYGVNNRFLALDLHTDPSTSPLTITYQPVVVDLTAWSGGPAQTGHFLSPLSLPTSVQQHIYISPAYIPSSPRKWPCFLCLVWPP